MSKRTLLPVLAGIFALGYVGAASADIHIHSQPSDGAIVGQIANNLLPPEDLDLKVGTGNITMVNTLLPLHVEVQTGVGGVNRHYYHGALIDITTTLIDLPCIGQAC